ncbi:Ethylene-overproduction protein 1 [Hibiscus syriacus]|uniref:Ethylene-overproduction protein 1 n=1 Tax=Hibiscus syriacus TaxID=106335 RepID=A0A6A3A0P6_HIBSY|nr:Ethylene-overproduction protein 1 [Hibiscus syriacus]
MQRNKFSTMRILKVLDRCKGTQVYALNNTAAAGGDVGEKLFHQLQDHLTVNSVRPKSIHNCQASNNPLVFVNETLLPYGLPVSDLLEPQIEPCLKVVDFIETLADLYRRIGKCPQFEKSGMYLEHYPIFKGLSDPKLLRRTLRAARQHCVDEHSKIVLAAWLQYERREDELVGTNSMNCRGRNIECPKATLIAGYNPEFIYDPCNCSKTRRGETEDDFSIEDKECSTSDGYGDMSFFIGDNEIRCIRSSIASLSLPFRTLLYGDFKESKREKLNLTQSCVSVECLKTAKLYSRNKRLDSFGPRILLELLSFSNKFCCDNLKSDCDSYLASLVNDMEGALLLIEYGLEENAYLLVAACLQVFLRELPNSMHSPNVMKYFCGPDAKERLALAGHASFLLYFFLSQIAMEEDMKTNTTVMLLERLTECATKSWQKQLAYHQLGVVKFERKENKDAQSWFEIACESGHIFKSGCCKNQVQAWPQLENNKIGAAISEISKIISFKVSPDCLELRAWVSISMEDYERGLRDVRALLTLEPNYMMFYGKMHGDHLVELLRPFVQQWSQADCWMQLYDRWSSVNDLGSLAVVHHMLANDPGKSLLWFRQSLLLR